MTVSWSTKIRLLALVLGVVLLTGIAAKAIYSAYAANQSTTQLKLKRVIMEGGWDIPGLEQSKMVYSRKLVEYYGDKPIRLYVTAYEPKREVIISVPRYYSLRENDAALVIKTQKASIIGISKYEFNNKAFCYGVYAQFISYDEKTGIGGYSAKIVLHYYDEDGDGKFESYDKGTEGSLYPPKIPEWAQR
jgi:hypothetical protein